MSFEHVSGLDYALDPYPAELRVGEARAAYFERYGLDDGGYEADWAYLKFGGVPVVLRNTRTRKRLIRAHDLHHLATGCNAVWNQGELDVVAFEARSGVRHAFLMGWVIVLNLFTLALLIRPRTLFRCFVQSRGARNLFGAPIGTIDDSMTVGELRRHLGFASRPLSTTRDDRIAFLLTSLQAIGTTLLCYGLPLPAAAWWWFG